MEIKADDYAVHYEEKDKTLYFKGSFMMNGAEEYAPVLNLLKQVADKHVNGDPLTLDLQALEFLNSSGINTITKFVIYARNLESLNLVIQGSLHVIWQVRLLKNLQRLMKSLQVVLVE